MEGHLMSVHLSLCFSSKINLQGKLGENIIFLPSEGVSRLVNKCTNVKHNPFFSVADGKVYLRRDQGTK